MRSENEREEAERGLAVAAQAGIHRLAIPTPFQVGRVNAYLIEDSPLTLLDSGPNSAKAMDELEQALAGHGHARSAGGHATLGHYPNPPGAIINFIGAISQHAVTVGNSPDNSDFLVSVTSWIGIDPGNGLLLGAGG